MKRTMNINFVWSDTPNNFQVEFLIGQFILEVTFPFDRDLCCEYRQPIAQVEGA